MTSASNVCSHIGRTDVLGRHVEVYAADAAHLRAC
jgi:hypothetical protein